MKRDAVIVALLVHCLLYCCYGFLLRSHGMRRHQLYDGKLESDGDRVTFDKWNNPKYSVTDLDNWYIELGRSLLTIGSKGVVACQLAVPVS
jgi:hypothetical protein